MNVIECHRLTSLQEPRLDKLQGQTLSKKCTVGTGLKKTDKSYRRLQNRPPRNVEK